MEIESYRYYCRSSIEIIANYYRAGFPLVTVHNYLRRAKSLKRYFAACMPSCPWVRANSSIAL
jgi:hypothetical protein